MQQKSLSSGPPLPEVVCSWYSDDRNLKQTARITIKLQNQDFVTEEWTQRYVQEA